MEWRFRSLTERSRARAAAASERALRAWGSARPLRTKAFRGKVHCPAGPMGTESLRNSHLTPALALVAILAAACDPNVVIGAKLRVSAEPSAVAGSGIGGADLGGTAGSGGFAEGGTTETAGAGGTT